MQFRAPSFRVKPFKFQKFWLSNQTFPKVVANSWNQALLLRDAIDKFQKEASLWNKSHFGNIFAKKKKVMARLNGIQHVTTIGPLTFLLNIENELRRELDVISGQEEDLWALKSRVNWMIQGDQNTAFNHVSTLVRGKRNQILAIKKLC